MVNVVECSLIQSKKNELKAIKRGEEKREDAHRPINHHTNGKQMIEFEDLMEL